MVDATGLVPIVAIAPKKLLDESEAKMKDFTRAWLDGIARANKDASNVARRLANKEAVPLTKFHVPVCVWTLPFLSVVDEPLKRTTN